MSALRSEIDNNSLICFKCGAVTSEPVHRPVEPSSKRSVLWSLLLGVVFLGVAGFFLMRVDSGEPTSLVVWLMLGSAGVLLTWHLGLR